MADPCSLSPSNARSLVTSLAAPLRYIVPTAFALYAAVGWPAAVQAASDAAAAHPAETSVEQAVERMQKLYNETKDLKGKFKQVYTDKLYERKRTSYGYMYVKKPGMMRWNYVQPERKAFISDGQVLWVWEPEDKQAFRNPLDASTLSTGLTFLLGAGDLRQEFEISRAEATGEIGAAGQILLKLTPRQPTAQYDYLMFALRPSDFVVVESMVVSKHATNRLVFSELVFNSGLQKKRFQFRAPADTRVIETGKR